MTSPGAVSLLPHSIGVPQDTKPATCALCPFASHSQEEVARHQQSHAQMNPPPEEERVPVKSEPSAAASCQPSSQTPHVPAQLQDCSWEPEPVPLPCSEQQGYRVVVVREEEGGGDPAATVKGESEVGQSGRPSLGSRGRHRWQSKQYQCDLCPYVACGKQELRVHERETHLREGSDVIQCSQCNYSTNKISFWRQHKLVHAGTGGARGRIYMCKTCGWKTKYRHSLVKHIALHTGNKSFQCDQCGFACARKENLKRHKLTHLKKGVDGKGLLLKCRWCEFVTAHSNALRRHAVSLHNADENYVPEYQCDICDFRTSKLSNFSTHKITHMYGCMKMQVNPTSPLKCSLCPFVSNHSDYLQEHQRTHKELRCIQDLLGGSEVESDPRPTDPEGQPSGELGQEVTAAGLQEGVQLAMPQPPPSRPNKVLALRKIIGTVGQYVNGNCQEAPEGNRPLRPFRRSGGRRRRRWRSMTAGAAAWVPPCSWEVGLRPISSQRFRCPHCWFACHRKEGLRRHLSSHATHRPLEGPQDSGPPPNPAELPQQADPPTPRASNPTMSERQEMHSLDEPKPAWPQSKQLEPSAWVEQERQALKRERLTLERGRLALERERLALDREQWQVQRGVLALQEHKLRLQILLLEQQLNNNQALTPPQPPTDC